MALCTRLFVLLGHPGESWTLSRGHALAYPKKNEEKMKKRRITYEKQQKPRKNLRKLGKAYEKPKKNLWFCKPQAWEILDLRCQSLAKGLGSRAKAKASGLAPMSQGRAQGPGQRAQAKPKAKYISNSRSTAPAAVMSSNPR